MKKWLIRAVLVVAVAVLAGVIALYAFPGTVLSAMQTMSASSAKLEEKSVDINGYTVHYYDGGSGDTIVLLHGMGDDKNTFVTAAAELTDKYRVILPDLQGHGKNARDSSLDYSIHGQVNFLDEILRRLFVTNFTLGGNSMGGHVSAAYTLAHPGKVMKLVLVNAPGLKLDEHVVYGGFGKRPETREDFLAILDRVMVNRPSIPGPLIGPYDRSNQ